MLVELGSWACLEGPERQFQSAGVPLCQRPDGCLQSLRGCFADGPARLQPCHIHIQVVQPLLE